MVDLYSGSGQRVVDGRDGELKGRGIVRYTGMGIGGRRVRALRSVRPGKPKA